MEPIIVYFDGSCGPKNPGGQMGWGWHVEGVGWRSSDSSTVLARPENTNNLAEYLALEAALVYLKECALQARKIIVRGDSQLVMRQMFPGRKGRRWKIKSGAYAEKAMECRSLLAEFRDIHGEWVPRHLNTRADALSKVNPPLKSRPARPRPLLDPAVAKQAAASDWQEIEAWRSRIIDDAGPPDTPEQTEKVRRAWARIAKYFGKETP